MALTLTATATTRLVPVSGYPTDTTLSIVATPSVSLPGYLTPITDPTWGTQVERITNVSGPRNLYAKMSVWSATGKYLWLYDLASSNKAPAMLLDGSTYAVLDADFHDPGASAAVWSSVNDRIMYGCVQASGIFRYMDPLTDSSYTNLHTFASTSNLQIGDYEGEADDNDRYIVLMGLVSGAETVIVYDIQADTVRATKTFSVRPNNASISHSGQYVVVQFSSGGAGAEQGTWLYGNTLGTAIRQITTAIPHADHAYSTAGDEVYVWHDGRNPYYRPQMHRLSDGTLTQLVSVGSYATVNAHVSGRNTQRPGWAYFSNYDTTGASAGLKGCDQVFAIKLDGSGTVEVFAHAHHGADVYALDTMAAPSRDGKRVLFGSEWGGSVAYAYVAGMTV